MKFELHITGTNSGIIDEFEAMGIKTLHAEFMRPDGTKLGDEFMCSYRLDLSTLEECKIYAQTIIDRLVSKVVRVKIEVPFNVEMIKDALYIECHFKTTSNMYPYVRNSKSFKFVSTSRSHDKETMYNFAKNNKVIHKDGVELELCLYDTNEAHDKEWMNLFENK